MARFKQQLVECPDLFTHMLSLLFQVLLFVESANRWAISRAMLPLILLHPDYYKQLTGELVQSQPMEHRQTLVGAFENLIKDVEPNLQTAQHVFAWDRCCCESRLTRCWRLRWIDFRRDLCGMWGCG